MRKKTFSLGILGVAVAALVVLSMTRTTAQGGNAPRIDSDDIGGVVTSTKGPEAGVWVIAETRDLPVRYIKSVVTDDRGRFVVPDLPQASYQVWARGYGLIDSQPVESAPGKVANLVVWPGDPFEAASLPERGIRPLKVGLEGLRSRPEPGVHGLQEIGPEPEVQEATGGGEDDGHEGRGDEGEPSPDRKTHPPAPP